MARHQRELAAIVRADPNIDALFSRVGASGSRLTTNAGLLFMRLKPRSERDMDVEEVVQQLRKKLAVVPGIRTFVQNPPAVRVGARLSKAPYQRSEENTSELQSL